MPGNRQVASIAVGKRMMVTPCGCRTLPPAGGLLIDLRLRGSNRALKRRVVAALAGLPDLLTVQRAKSTLLVAASVRQVANAGRMAHRKGRDGRPMPLWVPITLVAALFQTWRTALQQRLRGRLSVSTAGLVRYLYAIPVGLLLLLTYRAARGAVLPPPSLAFFFACAVAGLAQVVGTSLLIMAFGYRNFAVGTAYSKTDAVQAALLSWLLLGEALAPVAWLGIGVGVCGVLTLSLAGRGLQPGTLLRATVQPAALCGLGAGAGFAVAGVSIKAATVALAAPDAILGALFALVVTNVMQTLMQGGYMAWREPAGLQAAFSSWRSAVWVGALPAGGSACWFASFALAPVALVRTLGQVEMVFTLLFSRFYLKESLRSADVAGLALIVCGVILVLLFH